MRDGLESLRAEVSDAVARIEDVETKQKQKQEHTEQSAAADLQRQREELVKQRSRDNVSSEH